MKDEVVKSIPFPKMINEEIKELSRKYGISGNAVVRLAVEKLIKEGGILTLGDKELSTKAS